jgi:hypothetical protein
MDESKYKKNRNPSSSVQNKELAHRSASSFILDFKPHHIPFDLTEIPSTNTKPYHIPYNITKNPSKNTMAQPSLATIEHFLAHGLKPYKPLDPNEECNICTDPWHEDMDSVVSLPCQHIFHEACITEWVKTGDGNLATCPFCRRELCIRYTNEEDTPEIEEAWEGLHASQVWAAERSIAIQELINETVTNLPVFNTHEAGGERLEDRTVTTREWSSQIVESGLVIRSRLALEPVSTQEYIVFKRMIEHMEEEAVERNLDTIYLEEILEVMDDHEEHAETRTIEDAYWSANMRALLPTSEEPAGQRSVSMTSRGGDMEPHTSDLPFLR